MEPLEKTFLVGERRPGGPFAPEPPDVRCRAPELLPHWGKPWLAARLAELGVDAGAMGAPTPPWGAAPEDAFRVPLDAFRFHGVIVGASGSGKTMLALSVLKAHLQAGASALVLDAKDETLRQALALAREIGFQDVTLVWPREPARGVPGFNPLAPPDGDAVGAADAFAALVQEGTGNVAGARMWQAFKKAATVVAAHGLSPLELRAFLERPRYRAGLLSAARGCGAWEAYPEDHAWFLEVLPDLGKEGEGSLVAAANKLEDLLRRPFARALFCGQRDGVDLAGLWTRPRLVLVHLDRGSLGRDGQRLLAGMLTRSLLIEAMRRSGKGPVLCLADEIGVQGPFLGEAVTEMLRIGRSNHLRVLAACQHLGQCSEELKAELLTSTGFRAFLRLGDGDAGPAARALIEGSGDTLGRAEVSADPKEVEEAALPLVNEDGTALSMVVSARWEQLRRLHWFSHGAAANAFAEALAASGAGRRAYLLCGGNAYPFPGVVAGLPEGSWGFEGPRPLSVRVRFPRPKVEAARTREAERRAQAARWLARQAPREAVVWCGGETAAVFTAPVVLPPLERLPDPREFLGEEDPALAVAARLREIERLSHGGWPAASAPSPSPSASREGKRQRRPTVPSPGEGHRGPRATSPASGAPAARGATPPEAAGTDPTDSGRPKISFRGADGGGKEAPVRADMAPLTAPWKPEEAFDDGSL